MKINKRIEIRGLTLYIPKNKILVLGDTHIGYEELLNKKGVFIPRFNLKEVMKNLDKILKETKPKTIILIGDLKHEFGTISEQEWRETFRFIEFLEKNTEKIIIVKGNHDNTLYPILKKKNIRLLEEYKEDDIIFMHGHVLKKIDENIKTIIIGHEHPAIKIKEGIRHETFKCFLLGKYKKKELVVLPSLFYITQGTDILRQKLLSPFLKNNIDNFNVIAIDEKFHPHKFGCVKDIKNVIKI